MRQPGLRFKTATLETLQKTGTSAHSEVEAAWAEIQPHNPTDSLDVRHIGSHSAIESASADIQTHNPRFPQTKNILSQSANEAAWTEIKNP